MSARTPEQQARHDTDVAELVRRTRSAQGLPEKVTDPVAIARLVRLLRIPAITPPATNGGSH